MHDSRMPGGLRTPAPSKFAARPILAVAAIGVAIVAALAFTRPSHPATEPSGNSLGAVAQAGDTPGDCQVYVLHHDVADEQYIRWAGPWTPSIRCSRAQTPGPGFVTTGHHVQATFFGGGDAPREGDWRYSSEASN